MYARLAKKFYNRISQNFAKPLMPVKRYRPRVDVLIKTWDWQSCDIVPLKNSLVLGSKDVDCIITDSENQMRFDSGKNED